MIDKIGEVKKAKAKSGNSLLLKSAEAAAYKTRFPPTMRGGAGYDAKGILMYMYVENYARLINTRVADKTFKIIH